MNKQFNNNFGLTVRICLAFAIFGLIITSYPWRPFQPVAPGFADRTCAPSIHQQSQIYREDFIENDDHGAVQVHSASIAEMANGDLRAVWFQGSREGAADVSIYSAAWDRARSAWSQPSVLVDRGQAEADTGNYIKTLGNPVLFTDLRGRTWLFFVAVTLGGWSGGDIYVKFTDDGGQRWSPARHLIDAPVPHSGTLVKGMPFDISDGSIGLPVYRSYGSYSWPELLHLDSDGGVIGITNMSNGRHGGLQPSMVRIDDRQAAAFLRYNGGEPRRILRTTTDDGGQTWSTPEKTDLPNPDSAISAISLSDGRQIIVFNNSTEDRRVLSMAVSSDLGITWKFVHNFETGQEREEYSYPYLLRTCSGEIHLVYTWRRQRIKHIVFNEAWLNVLNG